MNAGSITFSTELDNADLEKELKALTKKIEKKERDIADLTMKRDEAKGKLDTLDRSELEAEKKKLEEMKAVREKYAETSKKIVSSEEKEKKITADIAQKENERADVSQRRSEILDRLSVAEGRLGKLENAPIKDKDKIKEQKEEIRILAREMGKLDSAVQKYDAEIKKSTESLGAQRAVTSQLSQQIDSATPSKEQVDAQSEKVKNLNTEWTEAEKAVERYNAKLSEAERELDRQKEEAGYITQQLRGPERAAEEIGRKLDEAEKKLASIIEKLREQQAVSAEVNKALGDMVSTQARLSGLAEEFSLGVKIGLAGIAKEAAHVAGLIAKGVPGALKSATSAVAGFAKSAAAKIPKLMQTAFSGAAKVVGAFSKKLIDAVKNMNVFAKLSSGLGQKFKRLGSTIKQALVFSVLYKGLASVRDQMGAYLTVNTQFSTALRQLSGVFLTAFQPIYDTVLPALTALMNGMSQAAAVVSQFTARLFGTTAKQSQKSAEALYNEANALKATGSAAEEAAGSLAGFDEINSIQTENKSGGGAAAAESGPLFDYEYEDQPFDSWGEAFSGFLDKLLSGIPVLKESLLDFVDWLNNSTKKLYDMFAFPGVLEKVIQLGKDLASALNDAVNGINWYQLGQALGAGMNLALQFLVNFIYGFDWINLGQSLAAMINGAVSEIDWYAVGQMLWAGFKIAIETLAGLILGLNMPLMADAASNVVMGFFNSMTETIQKIPWDQIGMQIAAFLNGIDWIGSLSSIAVAIAAGLNAAITVLAVLVATLEWGEIGFAIAQAINKLFEDIDWKTVGKAFSDGVRGILETIKEVVAEIDWQAIGNDVQTFLSNIDWSGIMSDVAEIMGEALAAAILGIWGLIEEAWDSVMNWWHDAAFEDGKFTISGLFEGIIDALKSIDTWIQEHIYAPFINGFKRLFGINSPSTVMAELGGYIMDGLFNGINEKIEPVVNLMKRIFNEFTAFISGAFSGDWEKAWEGVSSIFKNIWNGIVSLLEEAVNLIIQGVNWLISKLNTISFSLPDWVPAVGGKSFGINIPSIPEAKIPRLAQGAVIPPNREFLAVLGDQRNGTNLETPEDLLRKIVREESGGTSAELVQMLQSILAAIKAGHIIMVDGQAFGRTAIGTINSVNQSAGRQLLKI